MQITGAELFVKALRQEGVDTLFAYPGGQAIHLFDALYGEKEIEVILPRHEQGLVHAADGYARATGRTGVCLVTSGPGATNLVTGIATAHYDCVPLVCFTGQVPRALLGKYAFQEVDIADITKSICKWSVTVKRREELGAIISKAFHIANSGRPGVVVVDLPKDIQQALGSDAYSVTEREEKEKPEDTGRLEKQLEEAVKKLKAAKRPLFLLGGGINIARANRKMVQLAEKLKMPVVTTIMGKGAVPTDHPLYVGNLGIHGSYAANHAVSECDLLFAIGVRFNDRITGKVSEFAKQAQLIHVDIDSQVISRNVPADSAIIADAGVAVSRLLSFAEPMDTEAWLKRIHTWKCRYPLALPQEDNTVTPQKILQAVNTLFENAVITTDVGQNQLWATQFLEITPSKRLLTSGGLGTMGYGLPAAIGARLGCPDREVIAICGDGGMQMNSQELATAVIYELPIIICIMNNGYLGNVRQWQEMFFERHYASTCLRRRKSCPQTCNTPKADCPSYVPDFVKLAESYGAAGIRVRYADEISRAFLVAKKEKKRPTVIEFLIGREENVLPIVPPGGALDCMVLPNPIEKGDCAENVLFTDKS
jgi:acetolactate synthase I/II/III large subunit